MPDTLIALSNTSSLSSEEGAEVPEEGATPSSPDSRATGSRASMSQWTAVAAAQRSPLQPYSLNESHTGDTRSHAAVAAATIATALRQRWVVFNKARIQEIFEATLSEMTSEWNNVPLPSDTRSETTSSVTQNPSDKFSNVCSTDSRNSSTKRVGSPKQTIIQKDTNSARSDEEGKENHSRPTSPAWSVSVSDSDLSPNPAPVIRSGSEVSEDNRVVTRSGSEVNEDTMVTDIVDTCNDTRPEEDVGSRQAASTPSDLPAPTTKAHESGNTASVSSQPSQDEHSMGQRPDKHTPHRHMDNPQPKVKVTRPGNPVSKKGQRSSKATSRAGRRGQNGRGKVSSSTDNRSTDSHHDNNNSGEKTGKQCWVALNKAMVFDIVDLAMSQTDPDMTSDPSPVTPAQGSAQSAQGSASQGQSRPPVHSELASLLRDSDSQPATGPVKPAAKRIAPVGVAGEAVRRPLPKRRRVAPPTHPPSTQQSCGLDLRSSQTKSKEQSVSVGSVLLSAILATSNPGLGPPPPLVSSDKSPPPSPILIDEEDSDSQFSGESQLDKNDNTFSKSSVKQAPSGGKCKEQVTESRAGVTKEQLSTQVMTTLARDPRLARGSAGRASTPLPQSTFDALPVRRKVRSASHESPKHGWVALSKAEVHTIVDSVMTRMFLEQPDEHPTTATTSATATTPSVHQPLMSQCTNMDIQKGGAKSHTDSTPSIDMGGAKPSSDSTPILEKGVARPRADSAPCLTSNSSDNNISCVTQGPITDHNTPSSWSSSSSSLSSSVSPAAGEVKRRLCSLPTPTPHKTKAGHRVSFASVEQLAQGSPPDSPDSAPNRDTSSPSQACQRRLKWKYAMMLRAQSQGEETQQEGEEPRGEGEELRGADEDEDEEIEVERMSSDSESVVS